MVRIIKPYLWNGAWVFDDPGKFLFREALIAGVPELIDLFCVDIPRYREDGFLLFFSSSRFPGAKCLVWQRREDDGDVYSYGKHGCWLCSALLKYFPSAPPELYVQVRSCV